MKHVASRLVRYANENKVIVTDDILDVGLRRLAVDKKINGKIRSALHGIDPQLELLVPYQVDDHEKQLKRYIQNKMGLVVNLSELKKRHNKHYVKLLSYGYPTEVIKKWGLDYTFDRNIPAEHFKSMLDKVATKEGVIRRLFSDHLKLYKSILHQAQKEGKTVKEYVEGLGYKYE